MTLRGVIITLACLAFVAPAVAQTPPDMSGPIVVRYELDGGDEGLWWGYLAFHGVVFDTIDDEPMIFNGAYRCLWGGLDNDDFAGAHCVYKIVLN